MSQVHPPDCKKTSLDVVEVVEALKILSEQAAAGTVRGFMISYLDDTGTHFCASAGACSRNPKASLLAALQALVQLCGQDTVPHSMQDPGAIAPQFLH